MSGTPAPRLPKPESLEAKFRLMTLIPYDKRAKRKHMLVFGFILDWFHSDYGNALASVRHVAATIKARDPSGAGLYTGDIHAALSDLVTWGYLDQIKGKGRAASRYIPAWDLVCVRKTPNTTDDETSVRENANAGVRENTDTSNDSVRDFMNEDPFTGPGHRTGSHVMGNMFEAAPVAPLAVGLEATAAEPASGEEKEKGDGFSEFWKIWPRKHGLKKARAEWKKVGSDVSVIIEAAGAWAAHYAEHGIDKKWIPEPANWLVGERWHEDLPIVHIDAKGAAISKAKANAKPKKEKPEPADDNAEGEDEDDGVLEFMRGEPRLWPVGEYYGEFIENDVIEEYGGKDVCASLVFHVNTPGPFFAKQLEHRFYVQCFMEHAQSEGQQYLADICNAVGIPVVDDLDDLLFKPLHAVADGRKITYSQIKEAA